MGDFWSAKFFSWGGGGGTFFGCRNRHFESWRGENSPPWPEYIPLLGIPVYPITYKTPNTSKCTQMCHVAPVGSHLIRSVLSNLVAIRHMWRQEILMWRQTVAQNWISNGKYTAYHSNSDKSGDSKTFFATIVANVAIERKRLDTTDLNYWFSTSICWRSTQQNWQILLLLHVLVTQ